MPKTLYLIDADIHDNPISNSIHIRELLSRIRTKHFTTKRHLIDSTNIADIIELSKNVNNILFVVHSFEIWGKKLQVLANSAKAPLIVYPTELVSHEEMIEAFNHPSISRFIVNSDYIFKHLTKQIQLPPNKIRFINSFTDDAFLKLGKIKKSGRIIVTPSLISSGKDFDSLLTAIKKLHAGRYGQLMYILLLKKHPKHNIVTSNIILDSIQKLIEDKMMTGYVRIVLNNDNMTYHRFLQVADIILLPYDTSTTIYNGMLIDAIVTGKAIVAPDALRYQIDNEHRLIDMQKSFKGENNDEYLELSQQRHCYDFAKKEIGVSLYQNNNVDSISLACGTIFENKDVKSIMEEQNRTIAPDFTYSAAAPQLLALIKKQK